MRTNEERQRLIYRRTVEIRKENRKRRECMIGAVGIGMCLFLIAGAGYLLPGLTRQTTVAKMDYTSGMASMLGQYDALGYICMGILAFTLGICVTVLLYRLRKMEEHRQAEDAYKEKQRKKQKSGEKQDEF